MGMTVKTRRTTTAVQENIACGNAMQCNRAGHVRHTRTKNNDQYDEPRVPSCAAAM